MNTIISWSEYNGKEESLPKEKVEVLIVECYDDTIQSAIRKGLDWVSGEWRFSINKGDLWSYSPKVIRNKK